MKFPIKTLLLCAALSAAGSVQAETAAPRVVGSVDATPRAAPAAAACGREHQSGVSDCTHDKRLSRTRNAQIFRAFWGEDGSEADHAMIESGNAQFHDGYRSEMIIVRSATAEESDVLNATVAASCEAQASASTGPVAETGARAAKHNIMISEGPIELPRDKALASSGHKVVSSDGHVIDKSVFLALSAHRKRPSHRRNTRCPRW
jgi:hypothetical protein